MTKVWSNEPYDISQAVAARNRASDAESLSTAQLLQQRLHSREGAYPRFETGQSKPTKGDVMWSANIRGTERSASTSYVKPVPDAELWA